MNETQTLGKALCNLMGIEFPPTKESLNTMRLGINKLEGYASKKELENAWFAVNALEVFVE